MNNRGNIKDRIKTCPVCGYEWLARTAKPPRCPNFKCQAKLTYPDEVKA